jgi:hypothetical protein
VGNKTPIIINEKGIKFKKSQPNIKAAINDPIIFFDSLNNTKPIEKNKLETINKLINHLE